LELEERENNLKKKEDKVAKNKKIKEKEIRKKK